MTGDAKSENGSYQVETVETEAGTFVEIYDPDHSEDEPAAFLPALDAVEMAKTILREFGIRQVERDDDE